MDTTELTQRVLELKKLVEESGIDGTKELDELEAKI